MYIRLANVSTMNSSTAILEYINLAINNDTGEQNTIEKSVIKLNQTN